MFCLNLFNAFDDSLLSTWNLPGRAFEVMDFGRGAKAAQLQNFEAVVSPKTILSYLSSLVFVPVESLEFTSDIFRLCSLI